MVTYQMEYEHTVGNSVSFKTQDLAIAYHRHFLRIEARPDNELMVVDPTVIQRVFTCSAIIDGDDANTLNGWFTAAITYTGAYPRLKTIHFDGDTTITNIEVAMTSFKIHDKGNGQWLATMTFMEKTK